MTIQQELPHTVTPIEHLNSLVREDGTEWLQKPFSVDWNGARWSGASDGHALTLLRQEVPGVESIGDAQRAILNVLAPSRASGQKQAIAGWAAVLEFLSAGVLLPPPVCPKCKGNKKPVVACERCDGDGEIECWECGHEKDCPDCNGVGRTGGCSACDDAEDERKKPLPGLVVPGVYIDRRLMMRVLGPLRPEKLLISYDKELDPVRLTDESGSWFALVMPMSQDSKPGDVPALRLT